MNSRMALALALALSVSSCRIYRGKEDLPPPVPVPERYAHATAGSAATSRWWQAFGDATLDGLVETALADNLDLRRGWARLAQARALAEQSGAAYWPQVSLDAGVGRSRSVLFAKEPIGKLVNANNQFSLGAAAAYEVDLWGRVASLDDAAELDARASRQDLEALAMTLAAQVAETWFGLVEQRAQQALLREQLAVGETFLDLAEARFGQGLASALDVLQQRQQVAATRSQAPLVAARVATLEHQLAVLQGKPPGAVAQAGAVPLAALPPLPELGVPADLLRRRPDVRAAHLRVGAADHRVGAAIADQFPSLRLSASTGFLAQDIAKLFDGWIYSLSAGLAHTLWDGGRRSAEVDRARAVVQDLLAAYGQTLLLALREVEDALVREREQQRYLVELRAQLDVARAALAEARSRYVNGLSDYLPVLTSLQAVQGLERTELAARRDALSFRVQLCRALGGDWTTTLRRADGGPGAPTGSDIDHGTTTPDAGPSARPEGSPQP